MIRTNTIHRRQNPKSSFIYFASLAISNNEVHGRLVEWLRPFDANPKVYRVTTTKRSSHHVMMQRGYPFKTKHNAEFILAK